MANILWDKGCTTGDTARQHVCEYVHELLGESLRESARPAQYSSCLHTARWMHLSDLDDDKICRERFGRVFEVEPATYESEGGLLLAALAQQQQWSVQMRELEDAAGSVDGAQAIGFEKQRSSTFEKQRSSKNSASTHFVKETKRRLAAWWHHPSNSGWRVLLGFEGSELSGCGRILRRV